MKSTFLSLRPTHLPKFAVAVLSTLLMTGLATIRAAEKATAPQAKALGPSPAETRDQLLDKAKTTKLESSDSFQLALACYRNGQLIEATTVARLALGATTNDFEKAIFYALVSEAEGARGKYREAAQAALEGQRCNPHSPELALLRFAYFSKLGNKAQAESAIDCLAHTDAYFGRPVFGIAEGIIIVMTGKKVIEILAEAYQAWYQQELESGRCPQSWLDNPKVKTSAIVLEKLWKIYVLLPPPYANGQPRIGK